MSDRDAVLRWAMVTGRIGPRRVSAWDAMWAADPEGTEAVLRRMAAVLPPWPCDCVGYCRQPDRCGGDLCERCGGSDWVNVRAWPEAHGRRLCERCGAPDLRGLFRRWVGPVVRCPIPRAGDSHPDAPSLGSVTVHCGPPAPFPDPPTPEGILTACGIDPATVFAA